MQLAFICPLLAVAVAAILGDGDQLPIGAPASKLGSIPLLGFGTWNLNVDPLNTTDAVATAIEAGYIHFDCAAAYGNQVAVGKGIHAGLGKAGKAREDIWVTSKLWNDQRVSLHGASTHALDRVEEGLNTTLKELGLDYLDLFLMHWPVGNDQATGKLVFDYLLTWRTMETLLERGTVRFIGVSNFAPAQMMALLQHAAIKPAVHQMELHPYLQQRAWVAAHRANSIAVTAYSPLGNANPIYHHSSARSGKDLPLLLDNEVMASIAKQRGCTTAQVALAWGMARGTAVIPKTAHASRVRENFGARDCPLSVADMGRIKAMEKTWLRRFNNPSKGWEVRLFQGLDDA